MADRPLSRLREVIGFYARLGFVGFGGPMAHVAMMEREVVEKRAWLSRERFLDALAATNLVPGPNSTEMAVHIGYLRAGLPGAIGSGSAFVLPAFVMMLGLSWAYFHWETTPALGDLFYGVKPAVIALILVTAYRLFRAGVGDWRQFRSGAGDWKLAAIFVASGGLAYAFPGYELAVLLVAGVIGIVLYGPPPRPRPRSVAVVALLTASPALAWDPSTLLDLFLLCLRTGGLLFGGGYVMIPLLQDAVVDRFGWLSKDQFLDGVALGQSTPGPIVITATFIGYGAAGLAGAAVATVAIFLPAFFFAVLTSKFIRVFGEVPPVRAALKGIGAAVVGTILAATARLAESAFPDAWAVAIALAAGLALARLRLSSAPLMAAVAVSGLALGALR